MLMSSRDNFTEENQPLNNTTLERQVGGSMIEVPTFKQFPAAMKRLFTNKLLMCNVISGIFYILGASAYMTFMSKYLEVQFHKNAADAVIITGPFTIIGVCVGFLASGYVISKKKPKPSKLLMWNVIVGFGYMAGQISYLYLTCPGEKTVGNSIKLS
jgi:glucose uptake protein GlcU